MSKIWREDFDAQKHRNPMGSEAGDPAGLNLHADAPTLRPHQVLFVRAAEFTFEFHSREQLEACLAFYRKKHQPSGLSPAIAKAASEASGERRWLERWHERLPMYLLELPKRARVVAALEKALDECHGWQ